MPDDASGWHPSDLRFFTRRETDAYVVTAVWIQGGNRDEVEAAWREAEVKYSHREDSDHA